MYFIFWHHVHHVMCLSVSGNGKGWCISSFDIMYNIMWCVQLWVVVVKDDVRSRAIKERDIGSVTVSPVFHLFHIKQLHGYKLQLDLSTASNMQLWVWPGWVFSRRKLTTCWTFPLNQLPPASSWRTCPTYSSDSLSLSTPWTTALYYI